MTDENTLYDLCGLLFERLRNLHEQGIEPTAEEKQWLTILGIAIVDTVGSEEFFDAMECGIEVVDAKEGGWHTVYPFEEKL